MTTYPWLALRGSTYYLRAPVPSEIQKTYGKTEIWKSLRTKDRKQAIDRLREESAKIVTEFGAHKREIARLAEPPLEELTVAQLKAIEDAYFIHLLEEDEETRETGFEGRDFDEDAEWLEVLDAANREEYARGQPSEFIRDEARDVLGWTNVDLRLSKRSPSWPKLYRAIQAAARRAAEIRKKRNVGDVIETPTAVPISGAAPKPTLEDAKDFYITERVSGSPFARKKRITRLETMMRTVKEALGTVPALPDWSVDDAYKVRDYLLGKGTLKASTVRRDLNDLKGVFSLYKLKKLRSMDNPFAGMDLPKSAVTDKEARDALPPEVIQKMRVLLKAKANPDIWNIWRLLEGTGCRLGEIAGIRVQDIVLDDPVPHLKIVAHEARTLKNKSSRRDVPLIGDALAAAKEALKSAGSGPAVFARYSGPAGPNTASQVLMKRLREVTSNPLHAVHSLRHNMADRLDLAGVHPTDKAALLGHLNIGASEKHYGTEAVKRTVLSRALAQAFAGRGVAEQ